MHARPPVALPVEDLPHGMRPSRRRASPRGWQQTAQPARHALNGTRHVHALALACHTPAQPTRPRASLASDSIPACLAAQVSRGRLVAAQHVRRAWRRFARVLVPRLECNWDPGWGFVRFAKSTRGATAVDGTPSCVSGCNMHVDYEHDASARPLASYDFRTAEHARTPALAPTRNAHPPPLASGGVRCGTVVGIRACAHNRRPGTVRTTARSRRPCMSACVRACLFVCLLCAAVCACACVCSNCSRSRLCCAVRAMPPVCACVRVLHVCGECACMRACVC